jgi:hypothetical protein
MSLGCHSWLGQEFLRKKVFCILFPTQFLFQDIDKELKKDI